MIWNLLACKQPACYASVSDRVKSYSKTCNKKCNFFCNIVAKRVEELCCATSLFNSFGNKIAKQDVRFFLPVQRCPYAGYKQTLCCLSLARESCIFKGGGWSLAKIFGLIIFVSYCNSHFSFSRRLKFVAWNLRKKNLVRSVEHPRLKRWVMVTSSIIFLYATAGLHVMRTTARSWGSWYQLMRAESQGEAH